MRLRGISFYTFSRGFDEETVRAIRNVYDSVDEIVYASSTPFSPFQIPFDHQSKIHTYFHPFVTFAEMRNFCISQTHHEWILSLDSDETFSDTALHNLKSYIHRAWEGVKFNRVYIRKPAFLRDPFSQLRLFKWTQNRRYVGTVHEKLTDIQNIHELHSWSSVIIHHKTDEQMIANHDAYNELLKKELEYAEKAHNQHLVEFTQLRMWANNTIDDIRNFHDLRLMTKLKKEHAKRKLAFLKGKKNYFEEITHLEELYKNNCT